MPELPNPASNPCFGCGPEHPRGLQLTFEQTKTADGEPVVETRYTPAEDEVGWPGFMHGGLHFTLLYETSYWTALTLGPGVMTQRGTLGFDQPVVPRTGREVRVVGRIVDESEGTFTIQAESRGTDDRLLARLEGPWRPVGREKVEGAGIELPDYLLEDMVD